VKLSHDPNNTKWTRDTGGFGHKIMTSQGWRPGEYLGVKDASHAEFHTAANASHIRVTIKDDNLGLGAKKGSGVGEGECTGLDVFQNLLGRLNGRDEDEMAKEQRSREDLKRAIYTERKWGSIRFVPGGFLIGDKIQDLVEGEAERIRLLGQKKSTAEDNDFSASSQEEVPEVVAVKIKKSKKKKKADILLQDEAAMILETSLPIDRESKKCKKRQRAEETEADAAEETARLKKEKKEKKKRKKEKAAAEALIAEKNDSTKPKKKSKREEGSRSAHASTLTTPVVSGGESVGRSSTSTPIPTTYTPPTQSLGRHAVRSRNIAQKRLAVMDMASLNQIFMIKS